MRIRNRRARGRTEADNAADAPLNLIDDSDCDGCEHCTPRRPTRRGTRGTNRGRGPAIHCSACGGPAATDPCSEACQTDLDALTDDTTSENLAYEGWE